MNRFEPAHGFEPGIRAQGDYRRGMRERAVIAAEFVEAAAPRRTGYYERRIRARGSRVYAEDPFWHLVEFGSVNSVAYAPLRRGVVAAGLRFDPSPPPSGL